MYKKFPEWLKKYGIHTLIYSCVLLTLSLALIAGNIYGYIIGGVIIILLIYIFTQLQTAAKIRLQRLITLDQNTRELLLDNGTEFNRKNVIADIINNVRYATEFVHEIGKGNFEAQLSGITENNSEKNKDNLAGALINMRMQMKLNADEEKKRVWATQGLANFGDLLRNTSNDLSKLSEEVVLFIIKYLKANQGGLFILNDDDPENKYLELRAAYAFERKKYLKKQIQIGEGLVGQVFLERETIHLKEIPKNYVNITSGLGGATPHTLILVPLKTEDNVLGVLEIASFKDFENHEIQFCEKISESISSTISVVRINERTRNLLEQSQQQSEEMRAQEEEMRQNMEELQSTQEEMARKEQDYIQRIQELETILQSSDKQQSEIDLINTIEEMKQREENMISQIQQLKEPSNQTSSEITWTAIEQLEKDLSASLEAARIAQKILTDKQSKN